MPLGSDADRKIEGIATGSLSLDMALGGQGIPRGRIIEMFGPESSGKTTLALHCVAQAQKNGGIAAFIDAEHALDPSWAKKLGVQLDALLVSQPNSGEEAMQICEMLVKSNAVDIIVVDSVAALIPKQELDGEIGDTHEFSGGVGKRDHRRSSLAYNFSNILFATSDTNYSSITLVFTLN